MMSPQLTVSSLFAVLAMAGLCVVTSARDAAGITTPAASIAYTGQAELISRLPG